MTLKQILTNVNRIPEWDVGRALTRPVTNPFLKFAAGWFVAIVVFALASMVIGITPSDRVINLLGVAVGLVCAFTPNRRSLGRGEHAQHPVP